MKKVCALFLTGGMLMGAPAYAQGDMIEFRYDPAQLQTEAGKSELQYRIDKFAGDACKDTVSRSKWAASSHAFKRCVRQVKADVTQQIQARQLTQKPSGEYKSARSPQDISAP